MAGTGTLMALFLSEGHKAGGLVHAIKEIHELGPWLIVAFLVIHLGTGLTRLSRRSPLAEDILLRKITAVLVNSRQKEGGPVPPNWHITIDNQERRRKVAIVEGRARGDEHTPGDDEVEFSLTLYRDQASLNVPASTQGRAFIARLTDILGTPRLEPTIKCSCSWGDGVMGAMLLVLWDLPKDPTTPSLQDLSAFLGVQAVLPD
jgi:hypothetical protein